jgi:hypothetical protein
MNLELAADPLEGSSIKTESEVKTDDSPLAIALIAER